MRINDLNPDHERHTVLFPTPVGPITLSNGNENFFKKQMDRVARNHDVSRPTANHNIITRLDHAILVLPCYPRFFSHMGAVVVEREEL